MLIPKIGCVPYLNARPLLEGLEYPVTELVPSKLCEKFEKGAFDAALLSSIDVLKMSNFKSDTLVVDGVAIASKGAVHSVFLAYTGELVSLTKIQLDPSSHTSNALLQIILGEFYGLKPEYVQLTDSEIDNQAMLLIGDPAISFRQQKTSSEVKILDLGEAWYRHIGLPFVFALWILKDEFTQKELLADALRSAKSLGLSHLPEIALRTSNPDFSLRYFTEWIGYNLGVEEKRGLELFQQLLAKYQLITSGGRSPRFI